MLTLVDCAGTERKEDSALHDAARRKEAAEINQSLHALKQCMRQWALAQQQQQQHDEQSSPDGGAAPRRAPAPAPHIPFRESALTRVLSGSFTRRDTLLTVVGTVSPSASDTEHTLSTLKTVAAAVGIEVKRARGRAARA